MIKKFCTLALVLAFTSFEVSAQTPTTPTSPNTLSGVIEALSYEKGWPLPSDIIATHEQFEFTPAQAQKLVELDQMHKESLSTLKGAADRALDGFKQIITENPNNFQTAQPLAQRHAELSYRYSLAELLIRQETAGLMKEVIRK